MVGKLNVWYVLLMSERNCTLPSNLVFTETELFFRVHLSIEYGIIEWNIMN